MKRVFLQRDWPESWRLSYFYDLQEVYAEVELVGYSYSYRERARITLSALQASIETSATVLDVAAGQGNFSLKLAEMGYIVTWNDIRENLIDYVKAKHETGTVHYWPGDVFQLPQARQFDAILATEIIEHVAHPDQFLRHLAGLLKPEGHLFLTTPNGAYFRNHLPRFTVYRNPAAFEPHQFKPNADGHIFLLYPEELDELAAEAGFEVIRHISLINPLTAGFLKLEPVLRVLPQAWVGCLERMTQKLPSHLASRLNTHTFAHLRKQ